MHPKPRLNLNKGDTIFNRMHIQCYSQNIKSSKANKSKFGYVFYLGTYLKVKGIESQDIFVRVTRCLKDSSCTSVPSEYFGVFDQQA